MRRSHPIRAAAIVVGMTAGGMAIPRAAADIHGIGAMGDSLSDEYFEDDYAYAIGWVEQLVWFRGIDAGPTAVEAEPPGGTWGEPRRTGFEYDWALSGADSGTLLEQGQHTGLAAQTPERGITHAVRFIGANDFQPFPFPGDAFFEIYNDRWSPERIQRYVDEVVGHVEDAVTTVAPTGVSLVVCTVPDFSVSLWAQFFFEDVDRREVVSEVIGRVGMGIEDIARRHHLVLIDMFEASRAIFGTNRDLRDVLLIGNIEILLQEIDTRGHDNPRAGFVHDAVHPHTHLQGVLANVILEGLNMGYGAGVPLFCEEEILDHAGIEYGGMDTLEPQIGPYPDFVVSFTLPRGDLDGDADVDLDDFAAWFDCLAGPDVHQPPAECLPADFNRADLDGD
jgi:hypothetical protein